MVRAVNDKRGADFSKYPADEFELENDLDGKTIHKYRDKRAYRKKRPTPLQ